MAFFKIDKENWARKEYFDHFFSGLPCTYSISVKLDITKAKNEQRRLYPAMLHAITSIVNRHNEFRTAMDEDGSLGIFDEMLPCYTVFHKDSETFSNIWTEYHEEYRDFCKAYEKDLADFGSLTGISTKPNMPANTFPVSMLPWTSFEGFNLNLQKGYSYLLPMFTMGKYYEESGKFLLPLSVQVHHAVCDGFHVCRFINELQAFIDA